MTTTAASRRTSRRRLLHGASMFGLATAGLSLLSSCGAKAGQVGAARGGKTPVVGYLALHPLDRGGLSPGDQRLFGVANADPFRQGLRDLGYVEGKTIRIEYRFAGDDRQRLQQLALELTHLPIDVLVAADTVALEAAASSHTVPVVTAFASDPVANGLITSLAHPGGNVTGPSDVSLELAAKRLELLKHAVPTIQHVGVFWNPSLPDRVRAWNQTQDAAATLGVRTSSFEVRAWEDFASVLTAARAAQIDAFLLLEDAVVTSGFSNLALFQTTYHLPGAAADVAWVAGGGMMAYGVDQDDLFRRVAQYVDRVLRGAKPAELPVDRAIRFALVFNMRAARGIGLDVPPSILRQATGVLN